MKGNVVKLGAFLVCLGFLGGHLGSQMVEFVCQGTDWVGGDDRDLLEANLLSDGLILAASSMDNEKCGYVGGIFGWFGAQGSQMVDLEC